MADIANRCTEARSNPVAHAYAAVSNGMVSWYGRDEAAGQREAQYKQDAVGELKRSEQQEVSQLTVDE